MATRDDVTPEVVEPLQSEPQETFRVLIVEDDPDVSAALEEYFMLEDYVVTVAGDGVTALEKMQNASEYDIVLLDVMLPRKNGFEVLEESQQMGFHVPVLMMSGRGGQESILRGFGLGAEDYLVKPFDPDELMARVRAILGRTLPPSDAPVQHYRVGSLEMNFSTTEVTRDGAAVPLTELEFDLLHYLVQNRGRVVSRKRLLRDAWSIDEDIIIHTISPEVVIQKLEEHVRSLRSKLGDESSGPAIIEAVFGQGYRFNG